MDIAFSVDTNPYPQPRPRFGHGKVYEPERVKSYKKLLKVAGRQAMNGRPLFSTPICITVTIRRNIKTDSRNFGDIDNHLKAVFDALNGVCYTDDKLIFAVGAAKIRSAKQGVDVAISDCFKGALQ